MLRRLAVFVGHFTLDAALAVVTSATIDQAQVFGAIDSLVAKSMVATRPIGAMMRYRLLDTTRAYALEIGIDDAERADLAVRHADLLPAMAGADRDRMVDLVDRGGTGAPLCRPQQCPRGPGMVLRRQTATPRSASGSPPPRRRSSWRCRCCRNAIAGRSERLPLSTMPRAAGSTRCIFRRRSACRRCSRAGNSEAARAALNRSLAIAEERGDAPNQLQLLGLLHMFHHRIGDFKATLHYARQSSAVSGAIAVPAAAALAHSLLGSSLHHSGDIAGARAELEAALQLGPGHARARTIYLDFEHYNYAGIALARTLWLQGYPIQAMERARASVEDAASKSHPVPLSRALVWAISVFLWTGDLASADAYTDRLISHAESHSLGPYLAVAQGYKGAFAICRGDAGGGVARLQGAMEALRATRYELLTTPFNIWLAQGLAATGQSAEGLARIDRTIAMVEETGDLSQMPELLRVKASLLLTMQTPDLVEAESCLTRSLELSRRQGARAWELRTVTDLAALTADRGERDRAHGLLQPVFAEFTEGFDTVDLKAAERLLTDLE